MGLNRESLSEALQLVQSAVRKSPTPQPLSLQFSVHIFDQVASTNQTLWNLIGQGASAGTVVIADKQTAGRGQWGRQWQSPTGGLYLSLALEPNLPASNSVQLTMCTAWGIASSLRTYGIPVSIKWPNDLVIEEALRGNPESNLSEGHCVTSSPSPTLVSRKLGGILTETRVHQGQIARAVVGVGINWANPVPESGINLQTFLASQKAPQVASLEMLAAITLQGIASGYQLGSHEGIETLLPSYLELLTSIGRSVMVNGHLGVVVGVTATGDLRVHFNPPANPQKNQRAATRTDPTPIPEICLKPGTISLGYGD